MILKKKMSPFELIRSPREYVYRSEITPHKKNKKQISKNKDQFKKSIVQW